MRDLLAAGQRLAVLVRDSKSESATERIEQILQYWERENGQRLPRPVLLRGDICRPFLGLSASDVKWVAKHCDSVMHSAASLKFHEDVSGEPWVSNLEGTRHMLSLCQAAGLRELHYVSTAYVCGIRGGVIYESELNCGQTFRNSYEESKLHAETLVRTADFIDNLTVYRPAVISGDSRTGYTNTYHGIYLYLRLMALLVPRQPMDESGRRVTSLRLPMTGDERRNVVPVDWVSKVMVALHSNPAANGYTFHLAPDRCLTPREIIEAGYSFFKSTGVEFLGYQKLDPATYNAFEAELLPGLAMYHDYESTDPHFDCTNLKRFAGQLPCPVIDETTLHTYIRFGQDDRWGKRRPAKAELHYTASDFFCQLAPTSETHQSCRARVALDLTGPGGGQWTICLHSDGSLSYEPGLDVRADSCIGLSTEKFQKMVGEPVDSVQQVALENFFPLSYNRKPTRFLPQELPEQVNG